MPLSPCQRVKPVAWGAAREKLGLVGESFAERVEGLDHYLDEIDILLDEIAEATAWKHRQAYRDSTKGEQTLAKVNKILLAGQIWG